MKLNILFQDKNIVVVEKPTKMPVQPDPSNAKDLMTALESQLKESGNLPVKSKLFLIHRLDRPVGGAVVFAKTKEAASKLSVQVQNHKIRKNYYAVVTGHLEEEMVLEDYLVKQPGQSISEVADEHTSGAKLARLKVIPRQHATSAEHGNNTLVEVYLYTGRHHQIRVQLSNAGYPIWGDTKYNPFFDDVDGWVQIALWASYLGFRHPIKGKIVEYKSLPIMEGIWKEFDSFWR